MGGGEEGKKGPALSPLVSSMSDNRTKKTKFSHAYLVDFVPCMNDRKEASLVLLHTFSMQKKSFDQAFELFPTLWLTKR